MEPKINFPASDEAEAATLACIISDPAQYVAEMRVCLTDEHFFHRPNRVVWQTLCDLDQHGQPIDVATVTQNLRDRGVLDQAGGPGRISELFTMLMSSRHLPFYVTTLNEKKMLRDILTLCQDTVSRVQEIPEEGVAAENVGIIVTSHEAEAFKLVEGAQYLNAHSGGADKRQVLTQEESFHKFIDRMERALRNRGEHKAIGIQTGWVDVDRAFGGLCVDTAGDLMIIGGKPGQGKSIAAITLLEHIAITQRIPTAVFPLEMGETGYADRLNLGAANVDVSKMRSGFFSKSDQSNIGSLGRREGYVDAPIYYDYRSFITTTELRASIQIQVRKNGVKCVIIDHMGQIKPVGKEAKKDPRMGIIEIMETLHSIRRDMGILVVLCVQLAKDADRKGTVLPQLSDLRGAAEIEEYATQVLFIHRPTMYRPWSRLKDDSKEEWEKLTGMYSRYNPDAWANPNETEEVARTNYEEHAIFCIRKNRHGPTPDDICARFKGSVQRFGNRTATLYSNNQEDRQVKLPGYY